MPALVRKHAPLMLGVALALVGGVWAGLVRSGWHLATPHDNLALAHGALMVNGFLGTLISIERAAALQLHLTPRMARLAYLAPLSSAVGAVLLLLDLSSAALLMTLGSVGMVIMFAFIITRHPALYTLTMALGAVCWLGGNLLWLSGEPLSQSAAWWMAFVVLTVAGERLELSRILRLSWRATLGFGAVVGLFIMGVGLTWFAYDAGMRLLGLGLIALTLWLVYHDISRRTIRQQGLPRFVAFCLVMGYVWLAVAGGLALAYGGVRVGLAYDALLHSVFLGFTFSMIFGHAPIILPALLHLRLRYSPRFYLHLALLHVSVLARVAGDVGADYTLRRWGAMLNALVLLVFIANTLHALATPAERPLLPRSRPALATYALVVPLLIVGVALIGVGLGAGQPSTPAPALDLSTVSAELGYSADDVVRGQRLAQGACSACHGVDMRGVNGLGKDLIDSEFVTSLSDADLLTFIINGRALWDAANTTGIPMPPRGGNPSLSDDDIRAIIAYLRAEAAR